MTGDTKHMASAMICLRENEIALRNGKEITIRRFEGEHIIEIRHSDAVLSEGL